MLFARCIGFGNAAMRPLTVVTLLSIRKSRARDFATATMWHAGSTHGSVTVTTKSKSLTLRSYRPFEMYGDVILTRDVTDHGLRTGDVGTVVERHVVSGVTEEGYSVEFFDMTGNTVAVVTLPASALRLPTPADRPAARALSA